jgi:hypothetical protein
MWGPLVALFLLGSPVEKPAHDVPQKSSPAQPKKRRTTPTPHTPQGPKAPDKAKTAMA